MGKIDYLNVMIHKQKPIFFPGEAVDGNLVIRVSERLKINCVVLTIIGKGSVRWYKNLNKK